MNSFRLTMRWIVLAAVLVPMGCGAGGNRQLESITVTPATTDAQGQAVQFTATGHWSASPFSVTPQSAYWGVCQNNAPSTAVTVSTSGMAVWELSEGNIHLSLIHI